jgi:hypothetical protein
VSRAASAAAADGQEQLGDREDVGGEEQDDGDDG